eukprot:TRINITY_DN1818_c0_g1_i6.p1 TRINITY_DN1818_c0_g1~~TRINITY_DN1818_c0_g1_i6.p1  ORF type:complete len:310 (+),score=69.27 TRINITY_DN1818_c0_g1_i6:126-1055(+)
MGDTPLHEAAYKGDVVIVKMLLEAGANIEAKNRYGATPMHKCCAEGHIDAMEALLAAGAECDSRNNQLSTPLLRAVVGLHAPMVKALFVHGANVNSQDDEGLTSLHRATAMNALDIMRVILAQESVQVNIAEETGVTPLHVAAWHGYTTAVELLVNKGANVRLQNSDGHSPLVIAFLLRRPRALLRLIVRAGADPDELNEHGIRVDDDDEVEEEAESASQTPSRSGSTSTDLRKSVISGRPSMSSKSTGDELRKSVLQVTRPSMSAKSAGGTESGSEMRKSVLQVGRAASLSPKTGDMPRVSFSGASKQ